MKQFIATPSHQLSGQLRVASDKSISHRAILLSSLAAGQTQINQPLMGEDIRSTINAMRACGVDIDEVDNHTLHVRSNGHLTSPTNDINCGNAGTLMRLFCGIAVGQRLRCRLSGDTSLMSRPMRRITDPLTAMGARIQTANKGVPPLTIEVSDKPLTGLLYYNRLASAQVKSALLLAGLAAEGSTVVAEPILSRDHSERLLQLFGATLRYSDDKRVVEITGGSQLISPGEITVPADISSAIFFIAAAAITPGSDITLLEVGINPSRAGALELLLRMGADVDIEKKRTLGMEEVADIRVRGGQLHGIDIGGDMVPSAIDDFPALFIAAASANGNTTLSGAGELRHKESDRLSAMATGLQTLGIECTEKTDGIHIVGRGNHKSTFASGTVDARGDHRIAMAFCLASLRAKGDITVDHCDQVSTSFPNFIKLANAAGIRVVEKIIDHEAL